MKQTSLKTFLKENAVFLGCFLLCWTALGVALLTTDKCALHLWLNQVHTPFLDFFFRYYTLIAEYATYIVAFGLLFYKAGSAIQLLSAEAVAGGICQIVKHMVHAPRPATVFDIANNPDALPLVEGITMRMHNSFPSGHTSTFFVLFLTLLFVYNASRLNKNRTRQVICQILLFLCAAAGGYSRIYLSQHFAADVFAGGLIGTAVTCALYPFFSFLQRRYPRFYDWHIGAPKDRKAQGTKA